MRSMLLLLTMMLSVTAPAKTKKASSVPQTLSNGMKLVFDDEFNGTGVVDLTKWEYETGGGGWGNHESQHYTTRIENSRRQNGKLVIEARREDYKGDTFTSARMKTKGKGWKFGRVEVRAKFPGGAGTWPAIWMMPVGKKHSETVWPDNGEFDIMEHVGREPEQVMSCFYTKNFNWIIETGKISVQPLKDATKNYHVYALEWDENGAAYSIDGKVYHEFPNPKTNWQDWPFDQEYYLILNMAMGGFGGDIDPKIKSSKMLVDWVRIYQKP